AGRHGDLIGGRPLLPDRQDFPMPVTPILATLGYVLSPDATRVLLIHPKTRPDDPHFGKYNRLGGKLHAHEDVGARTRPEVRAGAAIEGARLRLLGTISWPGFGKQGEDWFGFIFRIDRWHGTPLTHNAEGSLEWVDAERILDLPLWEGDRHFLP